MKLVGMTSTALECDWTTLLQDKALVGKESANYVVKLMAVVF